MKYETEGPTLCLEMTQQDVIKTTLPHTEKPFVCQFQEEQKEAVYNHEDSHDFKIH